MIQLFDGQSMNIYFASVESLKGDENDVTTTPTPNQTYECYVTSTAEATATVDKCEVRYK